MYLSHYNLKVKPFQISPDPKFLWLGETHKEALAILKYGILDNRGFLLLVGGVGTGKTTLINVLLSSLGEDTIVATINDPSLEILDFYNFLAHTFKMNTKFKSKGDFLVHFIHFLHKAHADHKKVLLIIDETQMVSHELLEEIRLLSNIEKNHVKLLNIFLVGQNELNEILAEKRNRALLQRITTRYHIGPLKKNEVKAYIKFRLSVAGGDGTIFNSGAIREIISFSECYPRLINVICDHALLTGYVKERDKIDASIIKECVKDLQLPNNSGKKKDKSNSNDIIVDKPARKYVRMRPFYTVLIAFMVIAGGYFYFPEAYNKIFPHNKALNSEQASIPEGLHKATNFHTAKGLEENVLPENDTVAAEKESQDVNLHENKKNDEMLSDKIRNAAHNEPDQPEPFPDQKLTINFSLGSDEFPSEAYKSLERFVEIISKNPGADIIIRGHTDSSGDAGYNKILSKFRANLVKSYFAGHGISPERIRTYGMGSENPVASNDTEEGRMTNRRIEVKLE